MTAPAVAMRLIRELEPAAWAALAGLHHGKAPVQVEGHLDRIIHAMRSADSVIGRLAGELRRLTQ